MHGDIRDKGRKRKEPVGSSGRFYMTRQPVWNAEGGLVECVRTWTLIDESERRAKYCMVAIITRDPGNCG